jgi:uncharacterized protein (TIGR02117 family)
MPRLHPAVKKTLKIIGKTLLAIVSFILFYLGTAFCLSRITVSKETNSKDELAIYILTNGVHTDIVMPAKTATFDWTQEVKHANTSANDTSYAWLSMGWGDKGFYLQTPTWADLKASVAFKAATGLSSTAIHTTYYSTINERASCKKIMISKEQYSRLVNYITNSFKKDSNEHFMHIPTNAVYGKHDAFYEANGSYSIFKTCNTWANNALKSCGQKCCLWTAFDTGIFLKYE